MGRICDICNTDLGEQTDYNFNRHRNSNQCQANQKKTSIKASSQSIKSYLKPSCLQPSGLGTTKLNELHSKENLFQIKEHFSLFIKEHNSSNDIPLVSY